MRYMACARVGLFFSSAELKWLFNHLVLDRKKSAQVSTGILREVPRRDFVLSHYLWREPMKIRRTTQIEKPSCTIIGYFQTGVQSLYHLFYHPLLFSDMKCMKKS